MSDKAYDVVALGELLVDFTEAGRSPTGMRLFEQNPGGAPANLLSAVSRFGASTALIGKVGQDMHGRFLKSVLDEAGIDTRGLILAEDVFTTLAFVALQNGEREFSFARKPGADTRLTADEVDRGLLEDTAIFHFGSLSLTDEPARSATHTAIRRARQAGALISYDPNYRSSLWPSREKAAARMREPLPFVDMIKLSDEETELLTGHSDPEQAARVLHNLGVGLVAVTLGKAGALVCAGGECRIAAGYDIPAVDTTGAGDSFWGGFLYRLLKSGKTPQTLCVEEAASFARFGNATATLCVTRRGGIPAMPTLQEVEDLMKRFA